VIGGVAAVVCTLVVVIFAITEFTRGAWVVVVVMPLLVLGLVRTNRRYRQETRVLEEGAAVVACEAPVLRRHVVVVLVDRIDLATARAIQYARTLSPDELRAVHFNVDESRSERIVSRWRQLGLTRLPLDVIECPDRRLGRAALELAAESADGETEVSMLLPRRSYRGGLGRFLHDHTADRIVETVSQLAHVNATIVPFNVASAIELETAAAFEEPEADRHSTRERDHGSSPTPEIAGGTPISELKWRDRAIVAGRVRSVRIQPWSGVPTLECSIVDNTRQTLLVVFLGRREIPGLRTGTVVSVEGRIGTHRGQLAVVNPRYEILSTTDEAR
jgi:hypothetical protein